MVLFIGQVASDQRDREAFQEVDYRQMFGPGTLGMAKWVGEVHDADRLPEYVGRAFHTALQGRPGPGRAGAARGHADARRPRRRCCRASSRRCAAPAPAALRRLRERLLAAAERPLRDRRRQRLGRRGRARRCSASPSAGSCRSAAPSASRTCSTTAIRTTPATSASASTRSSPQRVRDADLIIAIGPRLGEMTTGGYTLLRGAAAGADAGPHPRRRRGARPGLRGRPADPVGDGLRRAGAGRAAAAAQRRAGPTGRPRRTADYQANLRPDAGRAARPGRGREDAAAAAAAPTPSTPTAPATTAAGCTASAVSRAAPARPHPARADFRRDGLRRAGGGGRGAAQPEPLRRQPRRRRRLPDDRPGAGHRHRLRRGAAS